MVPLSVGKIPGRRQLDSSTRFIVYTSQHGIMEQQLRNGTVNVKMHLETEFGDTAVLRGTCADQNHRRPTSDHQHDVQQGQAPSQEDR